MQKSGRAALLVGTRKQNMQTAGASFPLVHMPFLFTRSLSTQPKCLTKLKGREAFPTLAFLLVGGSNKHAHKMILFIYLVYL